MPKAVIISGGTKTELTVAEGTRLDEVLRQVRTDFQLSCGGNHTCGKCKVRCGGALSPCSAEEACFLSQQERDAGIRLACFTRVCGDVTLHLQEEQAETLSATVIPEHHLTRSGWGVAVDIGTTTVAVQLYDLDHGQLKGEALGRNQQACFGADVVSRIEFSNQHGVQAAHDTIHGQLEEMAGDCMRQAGIQRLDAAVITGNTTMLHFWEGLDPRGIAVAPFVPQSLFGGESALPLAGTGTYLPPCLGAYIGADITCAILASGMMEQPDKTSLLIDLGTNGEIALYHGGTLYCASTAMGPAFEGAGLAYGMQASPGAVSTVRRSGGDTVTCTTIGGSPAKGICGSGILDAVRVMLELELLDESGLIDTSSPEVTTIKGQPAWQLPGTEVYVMQKDIRQIQLAKAAVCAGIQTLLKEAGIRPEKVDHFYIAGGFGHYMDMESAAAIGLYPRALAAAEAHVIGNAALSGAVLLLLDGGAQERLEEIRRCAREIPLSGNSGFSNLYVENIIFEADD